MKRPGYREALRWLLVNDDYEWLKGDDQINSVTSALIADLFGKTDEEVRRDLLKLQSTL